MLARLTRALRASADCQGIALFAAAALAHSKTASAAEDAAPSWERGLLYWLYPSAGLPASSNAGARFRQAESSSASDSVVKHAQNVHAFKTP